MGWPGPVVRNDAAARVRRKCRFDSGPCSKDSRRHRFKLLWLEAVDLDLAVAGGCPFLSNHQIHHQISGLRAQREALKLEACWLLPESATIRCRQRQQLPSGVENYNVEGYWIRRPRAVEVQAGKPARQRSQAVPALESGGVSRFTLPAGGNRQHAIVPGVSTT